MAFGFLPLYVHVTEPARKQEMQKERAESLAKWSAWEKWATENCTLAGKRGNSQKAEIELTLTYACKDGKTYDVAQSQREAARICAGSDLEACYSNKLPQAPR